jgi:hypothetical protein
MTKADLAACVRGGGEGAVEYMKQLLEHPDEQVVCRKQLSSKAGVKVWRAVVFSAGRLTDYQASGATDLLAPRLTSTHATEEGYDA